MSEKVPMKDRYVACMVLGAAGDALAFRNGEWEFQRDGTLIHQELTRLRGIENLEVSFAKNGLKVSDDTVMHNATAKALVAAPNDEPEDLVFREIAKEYVACMEDMDGRAPGITCVRGAKMLRPLEPNGWVIPFDRAGGGCGGAMRSMCIGLRYWRPEQKARLVAVAIESGRMTHNHPTGYLGALASALFTSYAVRNEPVRHWGKWLLQTIDNEATEYIKKAGRDVELAQNNWAYFRKAWDDYLEERKIKTGDGQAEFPPNYGVVERDAFYKKVSWDGWGGSSGHDAPMIAYDAFLGSRIGGPDTAETFSWKELTDRGFFHGGDSDSTGVIAGCWYGALSGYHGVPSVNYDGIEKYAELVQLGSKLYDQYYDQQPPTRN